MTKAIANAGDAKPFLKSLGGKTRLLPELLARVPKAFGTYHEPFVGGGALFWALAPRLRWARISDTNEHFVEAYRAVRDDVDGLVRRLRRMKNEEEFYYRIRARVGRPASLVEQAALTIFLNKTCFTPGSEVLTEDEQLVPIETLEVGQRLWAGRTVHEVLKQRYSGQIFRIRAKGVPSALSVTADHPVLIVPGNGGGKRLRRTAEQMLAEMRLVPASAVRVGDSLMLPREGTISNPMPWRKVWEGLGPVAPQAKRIEFRPDGNEEALARLFGYYAAEGCLKRRYGVDEATNGIDFCFNAKRRDHIADAASTLRAVFEGCHVSVREQENKVSVQVTSVQIGRFFEALLPGQSWAEDPAKRATKRFGGAWMVAHESLQKQVLVGWLRGDGYCRVKGNRAELVGTCSVFPMARQLYRMAQRCGLRPAWRTYRPGGKEMAVITFSNLPEVHDLGFALDVEVSRVAAHRKIVGDYVATRVKEVTALEYEGFVYNAEVDGDHLVCVDGVVSHNCFNGLWRENRRGAMNAPFGHYAKPKICDAENLRACSEAMRQCKSKVVVESFERAAERVEEGDFWYADPPYLPVDAKSFTGYGATGFGYADHVRLRDVAWMLAERGAHVLLSNADTPTARELYDRKPFRIETVYAPRTINSKGDGRGAVAELLISAGPTR